MPESPWPALEAALPDDVRADLRPGASGLDAAERDLGLALPADVRAAYAVHDGQRGDAPGLVVGLRLLPLSDAVAEWRKWRDVMETTPDLAALGVEADSAGAVRAETANPRWVPIADDGAGNHVAVDLDPGPAGTLGQLITFGADEPSRHVVAPSLAAFFEWLAEAYASGQVVREGGEVRLRGRGGFFDAAPDLLG